MQSDVGLHRLMYKAMSVCTCKAMSVVTSDVGLHIVVGVQSDVGCHFVLDKAMSV